MNGIYDANNKLARDGMPAAMGFVQPGDPNSFSQVEARLSDINNANTKRALETGGASYSYDTDGKTITGIQYTPIVQQQMKKDVSDALYQGMDALASKGDSTSLAQLDALKDKYLPALEPMKQAEIMNKKQSKQMDLSAFQVAAQSKYDISQIDDNLPKNMPVAETAQLRLKAMQIVNQTNSAIASDTKRQSTVNYNALVNNIMQQNQSGQPYSGSVQAMKDAGFSKLYEGVTDGKQKQAIMHMLDQPKDTPPSVKAGWMNLVTGQDPNGKDLSTMSYADYMGYTAGMDKADKTRADALYQKAHTASGAEIMSNYKYGAKVLSAQLTGLGYIKADPMNGRFIGKNEAPWNDAQQQLQNYLDTFSGPQKPDQIRQHAMEVAAHIVQGAALQSGGPKPIAPVSAAQTAGAISPAARMGAIQNWRAANKTNAIPTAQQLNDFISKQGKGP
jgi:hypothetical protein